MKPAQHIFHTTFLPSFFLQKQQYQIMNTIVIEIHIITAIAHVMTIVSWPSSNCHPKTSNLKPLEIS